MSANRTSANLHIANIREESYADANNTFFPVNLTRVLQTPSQVGRLAGTICVKDEYVSVPKWLPQISN